MNGDQVNATPLFKRVTLIGFGLIGGSIARAARAQNLAGEIVATARSAETRARVAELGIVDRVVETSVEAVKDADLVILCIPVGACGPVAQEIAAYLKPGAIVSDVGSVKGAVVRDMAPHLPASAHFVPVPTPASPNCSSTAGVSSRLPRGPIQTRSKDCVPSGRRSAPRSRS
jgi:cyclohexadieny/prephenate dehydrogenase